MLKPPTYQFYIFVDREVKTTKRTIITLILISVISLSLVNVASANPVASIQTKASTQTVLPIRIASVGGVGHGIVIVNTHTGWFMCVAKVAFNHGTTYYLQYHVTGMAGAAVIGSGVASPMGTVVIVGKLDRAERNLITLPGEFIIVLHPI